MRILYAGRLVAKFGYPVCEMKTGFLYVFKEQSKKGRVVLAHRKHVSELIDLTDEERNDFFAEVARWPAPYIRYSSRTR